MGAEVNMKKQIKSACSAISRIVEIRTPTAILFGVGSCGKIAGQIKELASGAVLIVTDKGLAKAGTAQKTKEMVISAGLKAEIFDGVEPDPDKECVYKCLETAESINAGILVGLGGGSSLDVAKVTAALKINKGQVEDYVGIDKVPRKGLPTILVPTTAGTGSEVSPIAVISDKKQGLKLGIVSKYLYCDLAVVDPELTVSCPAKVTAFCGVDTLTHSIEIYTNKFSVPIIDGLVLEAIRLAGRHLRKCVHNGSDLAAREGMSLAALYAGLGLGPVNTAAVHALAYPLGGMFNVPHGLANSILLPYVMEFNRPACEAKFASIAEAMADGDVSDAEDKAAAAVKMVTALLRDIGIPQRLRDINIPEDAIPQMAAAAMKVTRLLNNNPREVKLEDAENIYRLAY
jgi:alcohol dehydrogenase class IV